MSARKPISKKVRDRLADDPYMLCCALNSNECTGALQWHHGTLEFGETYRLDDWWSIVPLCSGFHHPHISRPEFAQRVREIIFQRRLMDKQ